MAQQLVHKHSNVNTGSPKAPNSGILAKGEIAVNYNNADPCLFIEKEDGTIAKFSSATAIQSYVDAATTPLAERIGTIEGKENGWDSKYDKPSNGIPKTDLASAVQTSLGKADTAIQSVKTINNTAVSGTGNMTLASSVYMNNTAYTPATGTTNTGRINLGTVVTTVRVNGADKTVTNGRVDLGGIYSSAETRTLVENEASARESAVSAEANARQQADTNLQNTKQNNINTLNGFSNTSNAVLVSLNGNIQWKPFNNILAGSTTPISSDGNDGDIYIQTQ